MKRCAFLCFALWTLTFSVRATEDAFRYRVYLSDKNSGTSPVQVQEWSSEAQIRREKQGIVVDSTDYPVSLAYSQQIQQAGFPIVTKSRWMNTVVVSVPDSMNLSILRALPFVKKVQLVWVNPFLLKTSTKKRLVTKDKFQTDTSNFYGKAANQVEMLGLKPIHDLGFKGKGKLIAVIDAGYQGADTLSLFRKISLIGTKDFIYPPTSVYSLHSHGTSVLCTMASNDPYVLVGTAPEANYLLLRSEDVRSEFPIEEDYWIAAAEYADSIGADIITSSLGYTGFDRSEMSYQTSQLDGKTAFISQGAEIASGKGMLIVNSAGNDGGSSWKKIGFPADAEHVLTVGSVDSDLERSYFSSIGPTVDHRIKPDVMAMGGNTSVVGSNGVLVNGSGTSFAAPLIAGMAASVWSALPGLKAGELYQNICLSGNYAQQPDTLYGCGIPNAQKIWLTIQDLLPPTKSPRFICYPNPVKDILHFANLTFERGSIQVLIYNAQGEKMLEMPLTRNQSRIDISGFPASIYLVEFQVDGVRINCQKIVKRN